jgi:hypothetical protein
LTPSTLDVKMVVSSVPMLRDNSKPQFALQQWNRGCSRYKKLKIARTWIRLMSESHWWYLTGYTT